MRTSRPQLMKVAVHQVKSDVLPAIPLTLFSSALCRVRFKGATGINTGCGNGGINRNRIFFI